MSTATVAAGDRPGVLGRAWHLNKPLTAVGAAMVVVLAAAIVGVFVDHDVVTGAPAWLKPAKFAISISIYSFTFLWLLTFVTGRARLVRIVSWVTAVAFVVEMVLIIGAAVTDTTSHFNVSTPLHLAVWNVMAASIVAAWCANLAVLIALMRQKMADRAFAWSLRLGVLISAAGMGVAFLMTAPTPEQLATAHAGGGLPIVGAHSVGVPDGGPGLPVLGWSTVGGDLRAPHFFGLHGLQLLPLFGVLLARCAPAWLRMGDRVALVITAAVGYLAFIGLTTWQALRGQPLVKPDGWTLGALAAIAVAVGAAASVTVARARKAARA